MISGKRMVDQGPLPASSLIPTVALSGTLSVELNIAPDAVGCEAQNLLLRIRAGEENETQVSVEEAASRDLLTGRHKGRWLQLVSLQPLQRHRYRREW